MKQNILEYQLYKALLNLFGKNISFSYDHRVRQLLAILSLSGDYEWLD